MTTRQGLYTKSISIYALENGVEIL